MGSPRTRTVKGERETRSGRLAGTSLEEGRFMKSTTFSPLVSLLCGMGCFGLLALGLTGCNGTTTTPGKVKAVSSSTGGGPSAGDELSIGFIYVGPKDDYGYNQAHAAGAAAVKKMPGVKVTEEE